VLNLVLDQAHCGSCEVRRDQAADSEGKVVFEKIFAALSASLDGQDDTTASAVPGTD
jgi:hypothetical protein